MNFKHLFCFSRTNNKKKCYLSSSSDNFEAVQLLGAQLNSNDYSFHSEYMLQEQQIKQNIDDSTLFIAFVTKDYLCCNKSIFEFHYAIENKKDFLCLLTKDFNEFSERLKQTDSSKNEGVVNDILTIEYLENLKLQDDYFFFDRWSHLALNNINFKINEIIKAKEIEEVTIASTANTPFIDEIDHLAFDFIIDSEIDVLNFRSALIDENNIAVITIDRKTDASYIFVYNSGTNHTKKLLSTDLHYDLKSPSLIAFNSKSLQILITDRSNGKLFVFDNNFDCKSSYDFYLNDYCDMAADEKENNVYLINCQDSPCLVCIDKFQLKHHFFHSGKFKPRFLKVLNDQIYIMTACCLKIDAEKVSEEFGESKIYILDKLSPTYKIKREIDLSCYQIVQPWTIIVDTKLNIYTTVFQFDENKNLSEKRYLCKINKNGHIVGYVSLEISYLPNDILFSNNGFYIVKENQILKLKSSFRVRDSENEIEIIDKMETENEGFVEINREEFINIDYTITH